MKCIWCKQNSDSSKSVEHILPESLGNQTHTLPRGWVCDQCNNYFARKIEHPFLDSYYGRAIRFMTGIPNKKGRVPPLVGLHLQSSLPIEAVRTLHDDAIHFGPTKETDVPNWRDVISQEKNGTLVFRAVFEPENNRTLSRFIAKVAYEVLVSKCIEIDGWNDEIVNLHELEEIRQYVRFNKSSSPWPIHIRKLYPHSTAFTEGESEFEVLNEWTILVTSDQEYFAVIAIFGIEYTINLGGPELDGYISWLQENDNKSPLYWNAETSGEPTAKANYFI